jgi:hypothetical protein
LARRGSVSFDQMPNHLPETLRRLSDYDLYRYIAGWREGTENWIGGHVELRRRENAPARFAVAISVLSLIVSVGALFRS